MPVVLFGFDAAAANYLERWSHEGLLPTLSSIMQRGCSGRISGHEMVSPHGLWLSLFSGISRSKHGYYYFRQLEPGTYKVRAFTPRDAKASPFWNFLRGHKSRVLILDAPETYTIATLQGKQLANWSVHNAPDSPSSHPSDLLKMFGHQILIPESFSSTLQQDYRIYHRLMERIQKKGAITSQLLKQEQFDLVVVVFSESHIGGHQFWKYRDKDGDLTDAIRNIYQEIDRQLGLVLSHLPQDSGIFVVSPMGIRDQNPTGGLTRSFCRKLGYHVYKNNSSRSMDSMAIARKMIPESLRFAIGTFLPQKIRQTWLSNEFGKNTNWEKTKAFALPSNYTGLLRVNLEGRESQGIVKIGSEYTELLNRLEKDLRQLIDPITGLPAVEKVVRTANVFQTDATSVLPDLFIKWKPTSYFVDRVIHPQTEVTQTKPQFFRSNNHSETGFFACAGRGIPQTFVPLEISLLDIAPTVLTLMGESVPSVMKGEILFQNPITK